MQAGLLSILYTVTLPRTLNLTCNLGHVTSNILTAHSAPELYLRQANQLESSEKNGNLTSAVFGNRALLRFNTLKPQLDSKKTWWTDVFAKMDLINWAEVEPSFL